ncbi:hypothetical protein CEP51_000465 [Fusarium floridanum]|uniref:Uncharacterized protein n=1 Tax=Fusarium floridanum TaxID=1325733 RepID=A0A428SMF8_9HYPO|nr:hypothetical protein CEP51_000465 [Fusarium floridanum]
MDGQRGWGEEEQDSLPLKFPKIFARDEYSPRQRRPQQQPATTTYPFEACINHLEEEQRKADRRKKRRAAQKREEEARKRAEEREEQEAKEKAERKRQKEDRRKVKRRGDWSDAWKKYDNAWKSIDDTSDNIDGSQIPWPTKSRLRLDLSESTVRQFFRRTAFVHSSDDQAEEIFQVMTKETKRWHSDKIQHRFGKDIFQSQYGEDIDMVTKLIVVLWKEAKMGRGGSN